MHFNALQLLWMSEAEMWNLKDAKITIAFSDGLLETNTRRTILSWYHWDLHRKYSLPLEIGHHIGNSIITDKTTPQLLSRINKTMFAHRPDYIALRESIWRDFYNTINRIYNVFSTHIAEYQQSTNILDLLEIYDNTEVQTAIQELRPNQASLDKCYSRISKAINTSRELHNNPCARACRGGYVKESQVHQIIGPRGYLTDVCSTIYSKPIMTGYLEGITQFEDILKESRSAAKAITFQKAPLQIVEYFNRKMQLGSSYVYTLVKGDCGSHIYNEVFIDTKQLKGYSGKFFLNEKTNKLEAITPQRTDLMGKVVKVRSSFDCYHRDKGGVCSVCFGLNAYQIPDKTNLGWVASTELCKDGSQLTLSVKHYDGSSTVMRLEFDEHDAKLIYEGEDPGSIYFKETLKKKSLTLTLQSLDEQPVIGASGLPAVVDGADVDSLSVFSVTRFRTVDVTYNVTSTGDRVSDSICVSQGGRLGSMSSDLLKYVQKVGYTVLDSSYGCYEVDMSGWDYSKPAFVLPKKHRNMLEYMSEVEVFIRSPSSKDRKKHMKIGGIKLTDFQSPGAAVTAFFDLVNDRLNVNVCYLEIMMMSTLTSASDPNDFNIPSRNDGLMFNRHRLIMEKRSLGGVIAYERQPSVLSDLDSYLITERMPHPLDPLVLPTKRMLRGGVN